MRVVSRPALAVRNAVSVMAKSNKRHSLEQIVRKIQDADRILAGGGEVAGGLKELNVTGTTYARWLNHCGGLRAADAKKLKQPEKQSSRRLRWRS